MSSFEDFMSDDIRCAKDRRSPSKSCFTWWSGAMVDLWMRVLSSLNSSLTSVIVWSKDSSGESTRSVFSSDICLCSERAVLMAVILAWILLALSQ